MTKVLHLITRYLNGGAEKTTRNAIDALPREKYEVYLGVGADYDEERLNELDVQTEVFHTIRHYNPIAAIFAVFAVARYLRQEQIDILHTHSTEAGIIGRCAGLLARTPVRVHEVHGDPVAVDRNRLINHTIIWLERLTAKVTHRIIVKSKRIRETYLQRGIGSEDQYMLIYHGIEMDQFAKVKSKNSDDSTKLLFVGRLADGKGIFDLLEAVERLGDVHIDIAGDGPLAGEISRRIRERQIDATMLGYRDDVPSLLSQADVFVLPSYREGTPRVITEALAAGVPVISTDIAGIPEQVIDGETGYLIEPGDIDALVCRISELSSNSEKANRMGDKATQTVEKFSIETAKRKYRLLYDKLGRRGR